MSYYLGIDYGTSRFKIQIFDSSGLPQAATEGEVSMERPHPGWVEQDIASGWGQFCSALRSLLAGTGIKAEQIRAVGTTGTTNLSLMDNDGRILRPAVLYGDTRLPPQDAIQKIQTEIPSETLVRSFGFDELDEAKWTILLRLLPSSKLLWLRQYEPEVFEQIHTCLTASWDFVHFRLCGRVAHWAGALEDEREILTYFGIPQHWFGSSVETGQIVGCVDERGSEESGLTVGTPLVMGGTDSLCMFLGAGMTEPEIALNAAGTTDVVAVTVGQRPEASIGYPVQHLISPLWLLSLSPVRGPTLAWFRDLLLPGGSTFADLDRLAVQAPPGSDGLLCLPYLSGEKGAVHDPEARGVLMGLDLQHEKRHLARAVLEGIAFSTKQILEAYEIQGVKAKEVRLCGGGARSGIWNQIKADIFNVPVQILQVLDTGCLGAAMLAAVAAGDYGDREAACSSMSNISSTILPDPRNVEMYRSAYEAYKQLYPLNRILFSSLKGLRQDS